MVTLARDHYRARRLDLALYTLTAILDGYGQENPPRDKNNADARFLRALDLQGAGQAQASRIDELRKVVELRPDMVRRGCTWRRTCSKRATRRRRGPMLEDALKYDASNVLVHLNLGDAYRLLGKPKDALDHLAWVVAQGPEPGADALQHGARVSVLAERAGPERESKPSSARSRASSATRSCRRAQHAVQGDDVDELLARAKNKKSIMEALEETPRRRNQEARDEDSRGSRAVRGAARGPAWRRLKSVRRAKVAW